MAANAIITSQIDPAREISEQINTTIAELTALGRAVALMKRDLRPEYPYGPVTMAETANAFAALLNEMARITDGLIGSAGDDWSPEFSAYAEQQGDELPVQSVVQWSKYITETVQAARACPVAAAA